MSDREALEGVRHKLALAIADAIGGHIWTKDDLIDALVPIRDEMNAHLSQPISRCET